MQFRITKFVLGIGCLCLLFLVFPKAAEAFVSDIEGYVKVRRTGAPVAGVWVRWRTGDGETRYAQTDASGRYFFIGWDKLTGDERRALNATQIDSDLDGTLDVFMASAQHLMRRDSEGNMIGGVYYSCADNPQHFRPVRPTGWSGNFSQANFNIGVDNSIALITLELIEYNQEEPTPTPSTSPPTPTPTPTPSPTPAPLYSVRGNVYEDQNKNFIKDVGEPNYAGSITIQAIHDSGSPTYPVSYPGPGEYSVNLPSSMAPHIFIQYTSLPAGYQLTYPQGVPPQYRVSVGALCSFSPIQMNASCDSGNIKDLNFGIIESLPWWQNFGADTRNDAGINNPIPQTPLCPAFASVAHSSTTPGVVFSGDGVSSFGQGAVSSRNWIVGGLSYPEVFTPVNPGVIRTSYSYLLAVARQNSIPLTNLATVCDLSNCTLPGGLQNGVYHAQGADVHLNSYTFPSDKNFVFLINGNLFIKGDVKVPNGATATFSVSSNILVDKSVGNATPTCLATANVEGFFSTDRSFILEGNNNCAAGPDKQFKLAGSLVVNAKLASGTFQNQRDICAANLEYPTYSFIERPDMVLNAPEFLKHQTVLWQEVTP